MTTPNARSAAPVMKLRAEVWQARRSPYRQTAYAAAATLEEW